MATIHFSNGETAEVENVRGHDPRTFTIPAKSYGTIATAWQLNATAKFGEDGETYLLKTLNGSEGTAILQATRARR